MGQLKDNKLLLSIITCYAKKNPPALPQVLTLIKELKAKEGTTTERRMAPHVEGSGKPKRGEITAEEALEYTCWLVKADKLYDVAIQTYDVSLVLLVAKHTQKDPKEYLPYLKSLQALEPTLRKYQIQKDLKQYALALEELSQVPIEADVNRNRTSTPQKLWSS
jgi:elongator complex protein 1